MGCGATKPQQEDSAIATDTSPTSKRNRAPSSMDAAALSIIPSGDSTSELNPQTLDGKKLSSPTVMQSHASRSSQMVESQRQEDHTSTNSAHHADGGGGTPPLNLNRTLPSTETNFPTNSLGDTTAFASHHGCNSSSNGEEAASAPHHSLQAAGSCAADEELFTPRNYDVVIDEEQPHGLAMFEAKTAIVLEPPKCVCCHTGKVEYACRQCSYELCEECFFVGSWEGHDERHQIEAIAEQHCGNSRSHLSQSQSGLETTVQNNSFGTSYFFEPCKCCNRPIFDEETVFRCTACSYVVCDTCFTQKDYDHDKGPKHVLEAFKWNLKEVRERQVTNKGRDEDGNKIINDYTVVKELGRGSYAKVKLLQHVDTKQLFAVKILKKTRKSAAANRLKFSSSADQAADHRARVDTILREIVVMKILDHPNIVKLIEVIDDVESDKYYVIMEYCERGPLHTLTKPAMPVAELRPLAQQMMSGLLYLHSLGLFHRDIKPANCLVDGKFTAKLADFGACDIDNISALTDGTPAFMCPELMRGEQAHGSVADSWAFAVTLYQAACGKLPYDSVKYSDLKDLVSSEEDILIPPECNDYHLRDLLQSMLRKQVANRMMLADAHRHPFFHTSTHSPKGGASLETSATHLMEPMTILNQSDSSPAGSTTMVPSWVAGQSATEETVRLMYARGMSMVKKGTKVHQSFYGLQKMRDVRRRTLTNAGMDEFTALREDEDYDSQPTSPTVDPTKTTVVPDLDNSVSLKPKHLVSPSNQRERSNSSSSRRSTGGSEMLRNILQSRTRHSDVLEEKKLSLHVAPGFLNEEQNVRILRLTLCKLHSLRELKLNQFRNLHEVDLSSNAFREFPMELLAAPRLQLLDLSNNRIAHIPETIDTLIFLERLSMHSNCVKDLHLRVLAGKRMRHIRLSDNPVQKIPSDMTSVENVKLVLDDSPELVKQWDHIVLSQLGGGVVVLWNDMFPVQLTPHVPWYIASKALALYTVFQARTLQVRYLVAPQALDKRPNGGGSGNSVGYQFVSSNSNSLVAPEQLYPPSPVPVMMGGGGPSVPTPPPTLPPLSNSPALGSTPSPTKRGKRQQGRQLRIPLLDFHAKKLFDDIIFVDAQPSVDVAVDGFIKILDELWDSGSAVMFSVDELSDPGSSPQIRVMCLALVRILQERIGLTYEDAVDCFSNARRGLYL